jgi:choline-sulfatase
MLRNWQAGTASAGRSSTHEGTGLGPMGNTITRLLVAISLVLLAAPGATAEPSEPYNVILLMSDEHNPRILGCYGDTLVKTPTLDALAAKGVRFTSAYCQNPICVPSRVSLVSGRMPCHLETFGNTANQKYKDITTLADCFVKAGYQAVWFGKTHWGDPRFMDGGGENRNRAAARLEQERLTI